MAENKDQNRDAKNPEDSVQDPLEEQLEQNPEQDLADIDQILHEEDPNFLSQIADIQIPAGVNPSVMEQVFEKQYDQLSILVQIKNLFQFRANPKAVLSFWFCVIAGCAAAFFIWNSKKDIFRENLFLTSYASWAPVVNSYNPLTESESFYENQRFSKNLMTLSKMFINVKTSENSGPTPMLALEVNVEGISADAIIEIKDREAEFKDLLLRFVEDRAYDELTTTEGKQNLCDQFRIIINSHLTQGQVRRVLLKSFIIKP